MTEFQKILAGFNTKLTRLFDEDEEAINPLAQSFDEEQDFDYLIDLLEQNNSTNNFVEFMNVLEVLKYISDRISDHNKIVLVGVLKIKVESERKDILHRIVKPLAIYESDIEYFQKLYYELKQEKKLTNSLSFIFNEIFYERNDLNNFIDAYNSVLLTSIFSFDTFKQFEDIYAIEDLEVHKFLIKSIIDNDRLITKFFDIRKEAVDMALNKLKSIADDEMNALLKDLLYASLKATFKNHGHDYREILKGSLIRELIIYLSSLEADFIIQVLDFLESEKLSLYRWQLLDIFADSIQVDQIKDFIEFPKSKGEPEAEIRHHINYCINLYYLIERGKREDKEALLAEIYKIIGSDIIANEKRQDEALQQDKERKDKIYAKKREKIKEQIEIMKDKDFANEWLIHTYEEEKEYFTSEDISAVKNEVIKFLSDEKYFVVEKATWIKDKENPNRFTSASFVVNNTLPKCIKLAQEFGINLENYRSKIIAYIPFAYSEDFRLIMGLFNDVDPKEIDYIIGVYSKERNQIDDLRSHFPENFIEFFRKYHLLFTSEQKNKTLENLIDFMEEDVFRWIKIDILDILAENNIDENYFRKVFAESCGELNYFKDILLNKNGAEEYQKTKDTFKIGVKANDILIRQFKNEDAVRWRINQVLEGEVEYNDRERTEEGMIEVFGVLDIDEELGNFGERYFANIFKSIGDIKYKDDFLKLLSKSLILSNAKKEYKAFASYMQACVFLYAEGLEASDFAVLYQCIQELINSKDNKDLVYDFKISYLRRLEKKYQISIEAFIQSLSDEEKTQKILKQEEELRSLTETANQLERTSKSLRDKLQSTLIITEGKTDRKHFLRAWRVLKESGQLPKYHYDLEKDIQRFGDMPASNGEIHTLCTQLSEIFKDKLVIGLYDTDNIEDNLQKYFGMNKENIDELLNSHQFFVGEQRQNYYGVFLPNTREGEESYNNRMCTELLYEDEILSQYFHTKKQFDEEVDIKKMPILGQMVFYDKKRELYIKRDKKGSFIFDTFQGYYDKDFQPAKKELVSLLSKEDFAKEILNGKITIPIENRKKFIPIFDAIEKVVVEYIRNQKGRDIINSSI